MDLRYVKLLTAFLLILPIPLEAKQLRVPGAYKTIQEAIDQAVDGDTVLVADGTYYENLVIRFKSITLASHFILDGDTGHIEGTVINGSKPSDEKKAMTLLLESCPDTTMVVNGLTITGGQGIKQYRKRTETWLNGGGGIVLCSPFGRIINNRIVDNVLDTPDMITRFGGLWIHDNFQKGRIIVRNNLIEGNVVRSDLSAEAAGLFLAITRGNCLIEGNRVTGNRCLNPYGVKAAGGGIMVSVEGEPWEAVVTIRNNLIEENVAEGGGSLGGGIAVFIQPFKSHYRDFPSRFLITNNVIRDNSSRYMGGGVAVLDYNNLGEEWRSPFPVICNNTLLDNRSRYGAGILNYDSRILVFNNILWNDLPPSAGQEIFNGNAPAHLDPYNEGTVISYYNAVQSGEPGPGIIPGDPGIQTGSCLLAESSPCIGAAADSVYSGSYWFRAPKRDYFRKKRSARSPDHRLDLGACESPYRYSIPFNTASIVHVPGEKGSIQQAIESAHEGDTVLVAPGIYFEHIDFLGKPVTVASYHLMEEEERIKPSTVIDGSVLGKRGTCSVVSLVSGEDTTSRLHGFTIRGGTGVLSEKGEGSFGEGDSGGIRGGGVRISGSGAIIEHNIIRENHIRQIEEGGTDMGAGVYACVTGNHAVILRDNHILENTIMTRGNASGAGVFLAGGPFWLSGNRISQNISKSFGSHAKGGGLAWTHLDTLGDSQPLTVTGNWILNNKAQAGTRDFMTLGGGIFLNSFSGGEAVQFENNMICRNLCDGFGGGMAVQGIDELVICNNTFYCNKVRLNGKNLWLSGGSAIVFNNILWTNAYQHLHEIDVSNSVDETILHSSNNSIRQCLNGCLNSACSPGFLELTYDLSETSLCIDRGVDSMFVRGEWYRAPGRDIYGNKRPFAGGGEPASDLGAMESGFIRIPHFTFESIELGSNGESCEATAAVFMQGGVPPFSFSFNGEADTDHMGEDLCPGQIDIAVTDATGARADTSLYLVGSNDDPGADPIINLFPNPVQDLLTLQVGVPYDYRVEITNHTGACVCGISHAGGPVQIDLSFLKPGLYVVVIRTREGMYIRKIIKL